MIYILAVIAISYLIGSIPTAYIFGKLFKGIDIREYGSGNVGATNVMRTIGPVPGVIVFVIDFIKGFVAVTLVPFFLRRLFPEVLDENSLVYIFSAAAVIGGHIWTVFLRFKGGKGVATTGGVMVALAPDIMIGGLVVWVIIFVIWRYVSLASIAAAIALPVLSAITEKDIGFTVFCAVLCVVGLYAHRSNIKRLLQGTESKQGKNVKKTKV